MRRLLLMGLLLVAGCAGTTVGPRMRDALPSKIDPPFLPISEQEKRVRERTAYPDPPRYVGPRTWQEIPSEQYGALSH